MQLIEHVRHDWSTRVPSLLQNNVYEGLSRKCYALLCILYHIIKSAVLLCLAACVLVVKALTWVWTRGREVEEDYEYEETEDLEQDEEILEDDEEEVEELPFCQLFVVSEEMCLLIDHVEMCPDETAFIRVVDDQGYTPLYKRKIKRDKNGNRYLVFSGANYYLDNEKTQPTVLGRK